MRKFDLSLYLVLDPEQCINLYVVEMARAAMAGGVTIVQLRDKRADTAHLIEAGRALKQALAGSGVPLIINDNAEAAIAIGADGLHIGQEDMPAFDARALIGPEMILGLSVETEVLATAAATEIIDYLGVGPVFATPTKADHKPPIGFPCLARIVACTSIPVVAIGGLKAEYVADVLATGAKGLAVVSAICSSSEPQTAAAEIARAIRRHGAPTCGRKSAPSGCWRP